MTTTPKKSRRTAAVGEPPARSRKPGNPGFSGYQYQIEVTIWVALDLMFAKESTDFVEIEPRTDEDLQAAVVDPSTASIDLTAGGAHLKLILQAKTRSTSPWSATAFADILLGHDADGTGRRRRRPLTMLADDPANRYVFITNEASAETLRPHEGEHLFDFPEVDRLPPHCREGLTEVEQAALAPRVLLLTGVTKEILRSRISTLLSRHGHVPPSKHEQCLRDLREAVRRRIEGAHLGRWDLSAVLADLVRHGGSRAPTRDMDHYIRPRSYDQIKRRLDDLHAVVIAGASGTGKTLTADILELDLRSRDPAFEVVEAELGPGQVRREFSRSEPILFHLRDPWGSNRILPGADRWSAELPKLLDHAGPNRKFLITSRSDVIESAGPDLPEDLQPYLVRIDVGDYGASRLAEIYDNISTDLTGHARQLAKQHRKNALGRLTRPYEVKRFLTALLQEDRARPKPVSDIIATSQIKAISNVIVEQLSPLGPDGAEAAAILWAMLNARTAVARDTFAKLGQRIRAEDGTMRPDLDGLIDFLMAGQNLRRDGKALAFYHPQVEDGLRRAYMRHPREAERALSATLNVMLHWDRPDDDWGLETCLAILRSAARVKGIDLAIAPGSAGRLDAYLSASALSAGNGSDYEGALRDLKQFGSESDPMARLARMLLGVEQKQSGFFRRWDVSMPADDEIMMLRSDPRTQTVVERFIRELLPFSNLSYQSKFISLLELLASDLGAAFLDGLEAVADPGDPLTNIDVLVAGALRGPSPDYDRIIERFARSASDADAWMTVFRSDYRDAQEHAVDADAADHILEEPSEKYANSSEGLKSVIRIRRPEEGFEWIANSQHKVLLLQALGEVISMQEATPSSAELEFLFRNSEGPGRRSAWTAIKRHWTPAVRHLLMEDLKSPGPDDDDIRGLLELLAVDSGGDPVPALVPLLAGTTPGRRFEILMAICRTTLEGEPRGGESEAARLGRAEKLLGEFPDEERAVARALVDLVKGREIPAVAGNLSTSGLSLLGSLLPVVSLDLAAPLTCLAASAGLPFGDSVERLMASDDEDHGLAAIQAILLAQAPDNRARLERALGHERYKVRRRAFTLLASNAVERDRLTLIAIAKDPSADVRLAFAELMNELRWPEAVPALVDLLRDDRNFASSLNASSWSHFSVARAAARALGSFDVLPDGAVAALLQAARDEDNYDPFVACAAISALATRDRAEVALFLTSALESAGLPALAPHRPLAQAAAWAIFDRAIEGIHDTLNDDAARLAQTEAAVIAGPLLLAIGLHPCPLRTKLSELLHGLDLLDREAVLRASAMVAGEPEGLQPSEVEKILSKLSRAGADVLSDPERTAVESWSRGLDAGGEFERFMAWLAAMALKLPLTGAPLDVRAYEIPERIGVMTMRSMTPFREEHSGQDNGT